MNWIHAFVILCYAITALLHCDIIRKKRRKELRLFLSERSMKRNLLHKE